MVPDCGAYAIRPYPDGQKKQDHFLNPYIFRVTLTDKKKEPICFQSYPNRYIF